MSPLRRRATSGSASLSKLASAVVETRPAPPLLFTFRLSLQLKSHANMADYYADLNFKVSAIVPPRLHLWLTALSFTAVTG